MLATLLTCTTELDHLSFIETTHLSKNPSKTCQQTRHQQIQMCEMTGSWPGANFFDRPSLLFTESRAVIETSVIPHETFFSDICQVVA